eukprot:TRINITY_DN60980_c0_g1_i1.p1 TRINITY_DN60980_c0_g1~~TRINITY_DN60980_c0_g1_i1.p1  ORF type:complete len:1491 (+),score=150.63 TRINITY_DN60980_c0_g1_i1:539-4474(+)
MSDTSSAWVESKTTQVVAQNITIIAAQVFLSSGCRLCADRELQILSVLPTGVPTNQDVCVEDSTSLHAERLLIHSPNGSVRFWGTASAQDADGNGSLVVESNHFYLGATASFAFAHVSVSAKGSAEVFARSINAAFSARACHKPLLRKTRARETTLTSLEIFSLGDVVISPPSDSRWRVSRLTITANSVALQHAYINTDITHSTSCGNKQSSHSDLCTAILKDLGSGDDHARRLLFATRGSNAFAQNVSFDVEIVARTRLSIVQTKISAASMLSCSGETTVYGPATFLDVSGRGCGPGNGIGAGTTRDGSVQCGSSGASHIGRGGWGVSFAEGPTVNCAAPMRAYDFLGKMLPTHAASGGGCGIEQPNGCTQLFSTQKLVIQSSGGGLLWVSSQTLSLMGEVSLKADGANGGRVSWKDVRGVSGGGSGGQIIMFASSLQVNPWNRSGLHPTFSARGGNSSCSETRASGAGAGGFVGLQNSGDSSQNRNTDSIAFDVSGGVLPADDCDASGPHAAKWAKAEGGDVRSLTPCKPGYHGFSCDPCEVSKYSDDGKLCYHCQNKPRNAIYTDAAWPNSTCNFKCNSGTQNVHFNPECLTGLQYVFKFFGGSIGLAVVGLLFSILCIFLLCRRKKASFTEWPDGAPASFLRGDGPLRLTSFRVFQACCFRRRADSGRRIGIKGMDDLRFTFPREQLPFHLCRAYLSGQNRQGHSWALDQLPPPQFEHLVVPEAWCNFAAEINMSARVPDRPSRFDRLLKWIHPPLSLVWERNCRRGRARALRACTWRFSKGSNDHGHSSLWVSASRLTMIFGCDEGATLGYLDVMDFSRSQLDFAPVDLRFEVRLLVAHGHGSYSDPYALDIMDPLVQHLSQTHLGNHAVCSVISTFNRIARGVHASNSPDMKRSPLVRMLQYKVKKVASHCGLSGLVQVLPVQLPGRDGAGDVHVDAFETLPGDQNADRHNCSFSDLSSAVASSYVSRNVKRGNGCDCIKREIDPEVKLCLVFTDQTAMFPLQPEKFLVTESKRSLARRWAGFSSPMQQSTLVKYLSSSSEIPIDNHSVDGTNVSVDVSDDGASSDEDAAAEVHSRPESVRSLSGFPCSRGWWRALAWKNNCAYSPSALLMALVVLMLISVLLTVFTGYMLYTNSWYVIVAWIIWPPITPLVGSCFGIYLLLSDSPWVGRIFVFLEVLGVLGLVMTTLVVVFSQAEDLVFELIVLGCLAVIKSGIVVLATLHIGNLEMALDLAFADATQDDFLVRLLTPDPQLRTRGRRTRNRTHHVRHSGDARGSSAAAHFVSANSTGLPPQEKSFEFAEPTPF